MGEMVSWTVADAVDYKGFPADRSKTGGWVPAALSLGTAYLHLFCYAI
uniref:Major facilitator superfamily protein n=1 Tax=Citrus limon TaxID=2708 RepID=A0A1S8ACI2_CITLI